MSALASLSSGNEGREFFLLEYKASSKTVDLQNSSGKTVTLKWSIEVESNKAFDIVTEWENRDLVSQYSTAQDTIRFEILKPEAFVAAD